jgi:hypothetical protein
MITNELIEELQCAFSNEKHFLIEPIPLTKCGHAVCKKCLPTGLITCKKCNTFINEDLSDISVSKAIEQTIKAFKENIFQSLEIKTKSKLDELKCNQ